MNNTNKESPTKLDTEFFRAQIKQLNEVRKARSRERDKLDRIVLTLTSGALALSVTLVNQSYLVFGNLDWLFASWLVLIIGLITNLLGYIFAELHFKNFEKGIFNNKFSSIFDTEKNWWFRLTNLCNWVGLVALVTGITLFAIFGYLNLK